jgi:phosphate-selective porin OprO and OprP
MKSTKHISRLIALFATGLVTAVVTTSHAAEAVSVEDRLNALEKNLTAVQKENADLKKQLGWDGKTPLVLAKPAGKESKLNVGGYIQGQVEFGEDPDSRYTGIQDRALLRRARLNVAGSFQEQFDFKLEGDFGANALSEQTGYRAAITDAFINWNRYSAANVKFGQFKTPFGYEQLVSDTKVITVERSLGNDRITDGRQVGLGVSGDFLDKKLGYSVGAFNGSGVNNSFNDNNSFLYAGRATGVAYEGKLAKKDARLAVGVNGLTTHDDVITKTGFGFVGNNFTGRRTAWGVDAQSKWGIFGLEAEYLRSRFQPTAPVAGSVDFDAQSWYALAMVDLIPKKLQALAKYEYFDANTRLAGDVSETVTLGLNYFIKGDDIKLSLNYLLGNPSGPAQDQNRLLARIQIIY